ncbi:hypothetical protein BJY01DRAFT_28395 [Aspergillus pseudoustus]|uniref:RING-type domain-containing protein n=1 Tax=Aspergillus pseudoustus TaxID=1810923 RepID=A0ABR4JHA7_9EURO
MAWHGLLKLSIPAPFRLCKPIPSEEGTRFRRVITKEVQRLQPDEGRGGVLADAAGLGKTLTTLARLLQRDPLPSDRVSRSLEMVLRLRQACNHGTYQPEFWARNILLREKMEGTHQSSIAAGECPACGERLPDRQERERPVYAENCGHILCEICTSGPMIRGLEPSYIAPCASTCNVQT